MGMAVQERNMEGWLYLIRSNRFGLQYSRKRYFILEDNRLKTFKSIPSSGKEEPVRSAIIDSCIRVIDNGRESYHRKVFFVFTLYNASNHNDQLKLGASSPEEAGRWIHNLQDAAVNPEKNSMSSRRKWQPFRLSVLKRRKHKKPVDLISVSSIPEDELTSDVIAPSPWKIFGCQNGLRLFKEGKDKDSNGKHWRDHSSIMAVGVIDETSEAVFRTLMSLGPSRSEGMNRRDLLLRRYWRREDDGTYVILYHSVVHQKCPPQKDYIRACLKSGGHVITPIKLGKASVVKHMLAVDWKCWKSHLKQASSRSITIRMLGVVAALREMFRAKEGNHSSNLSFSLAEMTIDIEAPIGEEERREEGAVDPTRCEDGMEELLSEPSSLVGLESACDEFYDVLEPSDDDDEEGEGWSSATSPEFCVDANQQKISSATTLMKKFHDLAVQKKGYVDLQEVDSEESEPCCYGGTLQQDSNYSTPCSWAGGDPSSFLIRGKKYKKDHEKIKAKNTLMQMVAADWLKSDRRQDDLAGRPGGIVQKHAADDRPEFFLIVNIQVPGSTTYSLALYYMLKAPLEDTPLLERFVNGDDAFRNSRFKLIPYISKGSWIVKQSVGKKACLIGQALEVNYFKGKNYLELDVDVGSSTVARGVVNLVLGYLNNLVIEMAFLIQGNTPEELPEFLLGTCRLNHLDVSKSVSNDELGTR
ncbi:PREDICTED: protein ENHANCED DISEASE RESISTANCE 2-like isoform X2 [Ipomoea nil]|uniref:protein ENHANCED DISEASE RESISTANCE 2-like isoform X2 n=1 Tax=Ipomoea nil TaxID=35883 RepID=UPI000901EAD7|nr:PREDICTED: protein ENHANCED DISEASE RESISTANCE 2-like isoform X2 [Ipomoea nil]